jgi:hypothetical protein
MHAVVGVSASHAGSRLEGAAAREPCVAFARCQLLDEGTKDLLLVSVSTKIEKQICSVY